jgi:hypothetical protein
MANPQNSAVQEIDRADALALPEFGPPLSVDTKSTVASAGSGMGFLYTLREVMRVRMAKFAALVLFVTFIAAVFAPWLAPTIPRNRSPGIRSRRPPASTGWELIGSAVTN